jgi:hypothetical protein
MKFNGKYILSKKQGEIYSKLWKDLNDPDFKREGASFHNVDPTGPIGEPGRTGFEKIKGQSESIDFSVKIVSLLDEKQKIHNKKNNQRVRLNELKAVYVRGAEMFRPNSEGDPRSVWAIARVNMFLRMKEEGISSNSKIESHEDLVVTIKNGIDATQSWEPNKGDLDKTYEDIESHKLHFDFDNVEELFLESEKDHLERFFNW